MNSKQRDKKGKGKKMSYNKRGRKCLRNERRKMEMGTKTRRRKIKKRKNSL